MPGIGKNCVVLGGQIEGVQGAIFLSKRGKNVTILEDADALGEGLPPRYKTRSLKYLKEHGIKTITGVTYKQIDKKGIAYTTAEGADEYLACDTILVFKSPNAGLGLYEQVRDLAPEVYAIGACNGSDSSLMVDAVGQGREVALKL